MAALVRIVWYECIWEINCVSTGSNNILRQTDVISFSQILALIQGHLANLIIKPKYYEKYYKIFSYKYFVYTLVVGNPLPGTGSGFRPTGTDPNFLGDLRGPIIFFFDGKSLSRHKHSGIH